MSYLEEWNMKLYADSIGKSFHPLGKADNIKKRKIRTLKKFSSKSFKQMLGRTFNEQ